MEYRLIRNQLTGETLVIGGDGYLSPPLPEGAYLTADAKLRPDWWRVERREYNTALWGHPLWAVLARCQAPAGGRRGVTIGDAGRQPAGDGHRRAMQATQGGAIWPVGPAFGEAAAGAGYSGAWVTG